jgi:hypothetical protein
VLETVCAGLRTRLKMKKGELGTGVVRCGDALRSDDE